MSPAAALVLHFEIETPRPLRLAAREVLIKGWCLADDLPAPPPVRLVTPAGILPLTGRQSRADVPQLFPRHPAAAHCGFTLAGRLPPGVHLASFEAQRPDGTWQLFKQLTLAIERAPFVAVLDEPVSQGTLRDRVKVGGWALDLQRGRVVILSKDALGTALPGIDVPTLPFMAAFAVEAPDLASVRALLAANGVAILLDTPDAVAAAPVPELGAAAVFIADAGCAPWLD